jgi:hypothetical protein
MSKCTFGQQ